MKSCLPFHGPFPFPPGVPSKTNKEVSDVIALALSAAGRQGFVRISICLRSQTEIFHGQSFRAFGPCLTLFGAEGCRCLERGFGRSERRGKDNFIRPSIHRSAHPLSLSPSALAE